MNLTSMFERRKNVRQDLGNLKPVAIQLTLKRLQGSARRSGVFFLPFSCTVHPQLTEHQAPEKSVQISEFVRITEAQDFVKMLQ